MKSAVPPGPSCHSEEVIKNGGSRHGKQSYRCRECGRQLVAAPQWRRISEEMKGMIDRLLLEKLSLAGIARALQISELWVQHYINQKSKNVPQEVQVRPKPKRRLRVQMDELWSFVDDKGNEQWVWLGIDVATRFYCRLLYWRPQSHLGSGTLALLSCGGSRLVRSSERDFWVSDPVALPSQWHRAVGKQTG